MNNKCIGCGSVFQSTNSNSPGYITKEKVNDASYCERCFKIIHYGESLVVLAPKEIDSIIETVNNDHKHVLFITDLLSMNEDIINVYHKINYPKTLVINKFDLVKHLLKPHQIKDYLNKNYQIKDNVLFLSSINNHNIKDLIEYLDKSKINESYMVGFINSGKSTIINTILKMTNQEILGLTTSFIPHTTMNFINITINDHLTLIDSPGFSYSKFLCNNLDVLKKIDVKKKIRPVTYQMKEKETLVIKDLINVKCLNKCNLTVYLSNKFSIKKDYKINYKQVKIDISKNSDLVIKGVGFINFKNDCEIELGIEDESLIEVRPSIFGV